MVGERNFPECIYYVTLYCLSRLTQQEQDEVAHQGIEQEQLVAICYHFIVVEIASFIRGTGSLKRLYPCLCASLIGRLKIMK